MVLAIIEIALLVICLVLLVIFVYQNHTKIRVLGYERQMLIDWTLGLGQIVFERTYDYREKFKQIGIADGIIDTLCDYYEQKNDV